MSDSSNGIACCCLLVLLIFIGSAIFSNGSGGTHSNYYVDNESPKNGTFHVVNNTLTNGTYNITNLNSMIDVVGNYETYYDVVPSDFIFVYNDGENSEKYHGDTGLLYSVFNDTITGCTYRADKALTRGIAYNTNGTFNLSEGISFRRERNEGDNYYTIYHNIQLNNGSWISRLNIYDNLTSEQRKYFDDYDEQLYRYNSEKQIKQLKSNAQYLADMDTEMSVQNLKDSRSKDSGSFRGITSSGEYMYGHYN